MDIKDLQQERIQIHEDFWNNITPKRLPVDIGLYHHVYIEYSGLNLKETQYNYGALKDHVDAFCNEMYSDTCPLSGGGRPKLASFHQLLGAKTYEMSSVGYMQHPEREVMKEDEFGQLIEDPLAFVMDVILPRQYQALGLNPTQAALAVMNAQAASEEDNGAISKLSKAMVEKYGYYPGAPKTQTGSTRAPFDYIADMMRGFSATSVDLRRRKSELLAASEAVYPLMFMAGLPKEPGAVGSVNIALYMPTFMRNKDFEELFMPSFGKLLREYAALGIRTNTFCEDDYTRYIDDLRDFPANTYLRFEKADPELFAKKLGDKFILGGFFETRLLRMGTKEECLDQVKHVLEVMLPNVGYMFGFDKNPMTLKDVNMENLKAVSEYLRDNAIPSNPGSNFGMKLNSEGYTCDVKKSKTINSKYSFNWDEFIKWNPNAPESAKAKFEKINEKNIKFFINLLA